MPRLTDQLLPANTAYATDAQQAVIDLRRGAMNGWMPEYNEFLSNKQHVRQPLRCILLTYPKAFDLLPNKDVWIGSLRTLVEKSPIAIEGLNKTLEVEAVDTPIGHSGELHKDPSMVRRTPTDVSFRWNEKDGRPVSRFWELYISLFIRDAQLQSTGITTLITQRPADWLPDYYTFSCLFYEPDVTHTKIVNAWITANLWPQGSGTIDGKFEVGQPGDKLDHDIRFGGFSQVGAGPDAFARSILDGLNMFGANPMTREAFIKAIDVEITSGTNATNGFNAGVKATVDTQYKR